MPKKIPMRKCVITNERYPKNELIRVVRTPEGEVVVDVTGRANGHGAYLVKDLSIIESSNAKSALERALEVEIPDTFWDELKNVLK